MEAAASRQVMRVKPMRIGYNRLMARSCIFLVSVLSSLPACKSTKATQDSPPAETEEKTRPPLEWNGLDFTPERPFYSHDNDTVLYFHLPLDEGTLEEIEARFSRRLMAAGWRETERTRGLTDSDRAILADPEIDEEMKRIMVQPEKVNVDFVKATDQLSLFVRKDEEKNRWEVDFMYLKDVEEMAAQLAEARPCLRVRLCCRSLPDCDGQRLEAITDADACQSELDALLARLRSEGGELPLQCQFE